MQITDILLENLSKKCIVVDVQPAYYGFNKPVHHRVINFVAKQTGPVLMFVNADNTGLTEDTIDSVKDFWIDNGFLDTNEYNWGRVKIVDKGYGYFRDWMDRDVPARAIIKVIREMYRQGVSSSSQLWSKSLDVNSNDSDFYEKQLHKLVGVDFEDWMTQDEIHIYWTSVKKLKEFSGAYIMGGGRDECLREVELLMNAFNIKYTRIKSLVY